MDEKQTRLAAASLLLERGVKFNLTDAPFYYRFIGLSVIEIRPLYPGTIMELSRVILQEGLEDVAADKVNGKIESICRVIAIAMLNDKQKLKHTQRLSQRLLNKVPAAVLIRIFMHIVEINKVLDFTIITNYFANQMNQMMTTKNLGQ